MSDIKHGVITEKFFPVKPMPAYNENVRKIFDEYKKGILNKFFIFPSPVPAALA